MDRRQDDPIIGADQRGSSSDKPVVLITGASSQLGVFLLPQLINRGYQVIAVSRKAIRPSRFDVNPLWVSPDILSQDEEIDSLHPLPTTMISCGPPELAARAIVKWGQIQRLIVFSTTSVFTKAASGNRQEREQIAEILKQENILKALCQKSSTQLAILRPTMIYGCGLDQNISRLARWIKKSGWLPVAGSASGMRQPVHADDLAQLAVTALQIDGELNLDSPACGGSTLSYREMVDRIFDSQSRSRRVISLPPALLSLCIGILTTLHLSGRANREMVTRQNMDLVFDDSAVREKLDYNPRPFMPGPQDFEIPTEAARYQLG